MKTLKLIDRYLHIIEQGEPLPVDATPDATDATTQPAPEVQPMTSEGEKYLIDLLVKAFSHSPDAEELKIVDTINQEYKEQNPKEVAEAIEKLLAGGKEEFQNALNGL
jgi:hypothetical protein